MKKIIILLFVFVSTLNSKGVYTIEGKVENAENLKKAYIYHYYLGKYNLIDTAIINNGLIKFNLYPENSSGIYKIQLTPFLAIEDILFNYENISFECDFKDISKSLNYIQSNENKILNFYKRFTENELQKEKAFLYLLGFYSPDQDFYRQLNKEMQKVKAINKKLIKTIIEENTDLLVSKYIKYDQLPDIELTGIFSKDKSKIIEKYWDNIDFNDTLLLHLPLFDKKIENYLILVENDSVNSLEQENIFINAINKLLTKAEVNYKIYRYIGLKLLDDSKNFQLFNLYNFLATELISRNLVNDSERVRIEIELVKINDLKIGKIAPNIKITDEFSLYDIKSKFILVIFWEADCDLCIKKLREIKKIYSSINDNMAFEVVGINLNLDDIIYKKVILENDFNWINFSDFKSWNSELVRKYGISRTPTMILLDKNKRIISRPVKIDEIIDIIKKG